MAIAGFVLSLIGCVGVTAVLGFCLSIGGLIATRNRHLRGRGLAIAALPISLITGALSVVLVLVGWFFTRNIGVVFVQLPILLGPDPSAVNEALTVFREVCSGGFNEAVSEEAMRVWLKDIREAHGTLAEIQPASTGGPGGGIRLTWEGRFVNGPAPIELTLVVEKQWQIRLDDIAIDGLSPRQPE